MADLERHEQDQRRAEEMSKKPRQETDAEKRFWAKREAEEAEFRQWSERRGRVAFAGVKDDNGRDVADEIEAVVIDGGSNSFQLDRKAILEIAERVPAPLRICTELHKNANDEEVWRFVDEETGTVLRDDVADQDREDVAAAFKKSGAQII